MRKFLYKIGSKRQQDRVDPEYSKNTDRFRLQAREARSAGRRLGAVIERPRLRDFLPSLGPIVTNNGAKPRRSKMRRVPIRLQSHMSDCGPAALSMTLAFHRIDASIDDLRRETEAGRDGVSARTLLAVARRRGLPGRGVRTTLNGLRSLAPGSILFWKFNHFVVVEGFSRNHLIIVDPAYGRRRLGMEEVGRLFTGVALEFDAPLAQAGPTDLQKSTTRSPWFYLSYFAPRSRRWIFLAAASLLILLGGFITPLLTAYVIDHQGLDGTGTSVWQALLVVLLLGFCFLSLHLLRGISMLKLQVMAEKRVTLGVFNRMLALPYEFFTRRTPGDLALRVRTSTAVRNVLTSAALTAGIDGVLIFIYLILLLIADVKLALIVILLALMQVGLLVFAWRQQTYLAADALESQAQADGELHEILDGIGTLKSGGFDLSFAEKWSHTFAEEVNARIRSRRHLAAYTAISSALQLIAPMCVILIGATRVSQGSLSLGEVIAFTSLSIGVFIPLANLMQYGLQVASLRASLARLGDLLEEEVDHVGGSNVAPVPDEPSIRLEQVHFSYLGGKAEVLSDINLSIEPGRFVCILGPSGGGKSTLASIIAGLHLPTQGRVLIGDSPITAIDRSALRRAISFVNQDARIFAGSIRENIAMGEPDSKDTDIRSAAEQALLHDEIIAMPMGYDTLLGPGGAGLSGGQRQRVALARALVRKPKFLILDEATNALDQETESRVFRELISSGCTLVVITHRLSAVTGADEIVVISKGAVIQRGNHDQLISEEGQYRSLAHSSYDGLR
ncbi:peptidase domain-containing ABC transporter [Streptomyces xantholiticus]